MAAKSFNEAVLNGLDSYKKVVPLVGSQEEARALMVRHMECELRDYFSHEVMRMRLAGMKAAISEGDLELMIKGAMDLFDRAFKNVNAMGGKKL